jgi:Tc5 transposase DNA-binding domain
VKAWLLERNSKGLRVKDQYICAKARLVYKSLHKHSEEKHDSASEGYVCDEVLSYGTTLGWCSRFKIRNNLFRRCQTSCRKLPAGAPAVCTEFIFMAQSLIYAIEDQGREHY